jgi:uncharacterized protein YbcI
MLWRFTDGMVGLLMEFYGNGPRRTKSYYADDLVVCVLRGGFSRVEETLLEGGRGTAVIQQRMEFQELMRQRFEEVIETATGRRVIGFMSRNQAAAPGVSVASHKTAPAASSKKNAVTQRKQRLAVFSQIRGRRSGRRPHDVYVPANRSAE